MVISDGEKRFPTPYYLPLVGPFVHLLGSWFDQDTGVALARIIHDASAASVDTRL